MKKLKAVLIGAGNRGITYTDIMKEMPKKFEVVAVAEPIESRRKYIQSKHNLPDNRCFNDWKPLLALGKIADFAIISTMDRDHYAPAMEAISLKYDLLLEKPIAPTEAECKQIVEAAKMHDVKVVICTVLRYTKLFQFLKEQIDSGRLGKILSINHEECVGDVHQTHSFVRGNWGNSERSSLMLLQKSCHDMDILQWLTGKKCLKVQSFGMLSYFKEENAPEGAPDYCIEGCPHSETCPYSSVKLYLDDKENEWFRTTCTKMVEPNDADVERALRETQYGKCVYKCDNDVVDHQTVNMLFEDDLLVTFTMNAFNKGKRHIHIMGTKGEIRASMDGETPTQIFDFDTRETTILPVQGDDGILGGHGGGDVGIINTLYKYLNGTYEGNAIPDIEESYESHKVVFAAEKARLEGRIVEL